MKKTPINYDEFQVWSATMNLRWIERAEKVDKDSYKLEKVLQQKHVSNLGNVEWRDIPLVSE